MKTRFALACLAALLLAGLPPPSAQAQTRYTITDLGRLPGSPTNSNGAVPTAINNSGQVVGRADTGRLDFTGFPIAHAFLWDAAHGMQDLGTFSSDVNANSSAAGINDAGQIIGNTSFSYSNEHYGWLLMNGALTRLDTAIPPFQTAALALNKSGQILGAFDNNMQVPGVFGSGYFLWQNGSVSHLPDLSSRGTSVSYQTLNDKNQIAGTEFTRPGDEGRPGMNTAFLLQNGAFAYLPLDTSPAALNNVGQLALSTIPPSLWTPATPNGTSGAAIGTGNIFAYALNDAGQIAGYVNPSPTETRAAVYDAAHGIQILDNLVPANSGWSLQAAYAINQKGQIVGVGSVNNAFHGFLLTPVGGGGGTTQPALSEIRLAPGTIMGGLPVAGKIVLSQAAPSGGITVTLASANKAATVPASVKVPAGATFADFTVTTKIINPLLSVQGSITATYNGVTKSAALTVTPVEVKSLTLSPAKVKGGNSSIGTLTLPVAAPTGGLIVTLSSNKSSAAVPATVRVPAGKTMTMFIITTKKVKANTTVSISATGRAQSITGILRVTP